MTTAVAEPKLERDRLLEQQHIVLDDIPWSTYESVLEGIGDRPIRVTFHEGRMEIMAPLAEHESSKTWIARLLEALATEMNIPMSTFGSTTFRRQDKASGLEPDGCYYLANAPRVRGMKRFDPAVYPAPDLAIEVDITSRSIAREPIYANLGVPELWRYDGRKLTVLLLDQGGGYRPSPTSRAFPFLQMEKFVSFVRRMSDDEQTTVVREFLVWVRTLAKA